MLTRLREEFSTLPTCTELSRMESCRPLLSTLWAMVTTPEEDQSEEIFDGIPKKDLGVAVNMMVAFELAFKQKLTSPPRFPPVEKFEAYRRVYDAIAATKI